MCFVSDSRFLHMTWKHILSLMCVWSSLTHSPHGISSLNSNRPYSKVSHTHTGRFNERLFAGQCSFKVLPFYSGCVSEAPNNLVWVYSLSTLLGTSLLAFFSLFVYLFTYFLFNVRSICVFIPYLAHYFWDGQKNTSLMFHYSCVCSCSFLLITLYQLWI